MAIEPSRTRNVVLCDANGNPIGTHEIVAAHTGAGRLHLAFSVYVFSPDRRSLLIQQRSATKMLWPLVWANTCCSHPREGESPADAGLRRLGEEMGIGCPVTSGPAFVYRAEDPAGRGVEHEFDVILTGTYAGDPSPNPTEVADWKWAELTELKRDMATRPGSYAPWLHLGLPKAVAHLLGGNAPPG